MLSRKGLEAVDGGLHVVGDVAEGVAVGDACRGVAEQFLHDAGLARDLVHGRAVGVAEVVGADVREPELGQAAREGSVDGRHREGTEGARLVQIRQRGGALCAEGNRASRAPLAGANRHGVGRAVPVLGAVAHQFRGAHAGEGQDATADLGFREIETSLAACGLSLVAHGLEDAADQVIPDTSGLWGRGGESSRRLERGWGPPFHPDRRRD